jgi:hypothetical protein
LSPLPEAARYYPQMYSGVGAGWWWLVLLMRSVRDEQRDAAD